MADLTREEKAFMSQLKHAVTNPEPGHVDLAIKELAGFVDGEHDDAVVAWGSAELLRRAMIRMQALIARANPRIQENGAEAVQAFIDSCRDGATPKSESPTA